MDNFFDDYGWVLLLILAAVVLTSNKGILRGPAEDIEAEAAPVPEEKREEPCYIFRSSNRKRMRAKSVYF